MANTIQLGLKQSQKLVMTQSLRQSIEMLQLSTLELAEKISEELLENPIIEEETGEDVQMSSEKDGIVKRISENLSGAGSHESKAEKERNSLVDFSDRAYSYARVDDDRKWSYIENVISQKETLTDHLLWQAKLAAEDDDEYFIFENIITSLNEKGFLLTDSREFAKDINADLEIINSAISKICLFDPIGCACRDIQSSLVVQARHFYPDDELIHGILSGFFLELEKLQYEKIARKLSVTIDDIISKSKVIHNLNPFPGRSFSTKETKYIIPDIEVRIIDNEMVISLNDDLIPNIKINTYYNNVLKKKSLEKKQKDYIQEKMLSAKHLIKNISNRRVTLLKVVRAIMKYQMEFLLKGPGQLKYLTHLDIAQEVEIHESTVSRVTSNKFVQTSWGVFPLKFFFVSRLKMSKDSTSNEDHSSDLVKKRIREIVEAEDPAKPLRDDLIVKLLLEEGIKIARRTVAKYRRILNIPSSDKRKRINMIKSEGGL